LTTFGADHGSNAAVRGEGMDRKWASWVTFGSVLMMIVGAFKVISGIIGLFRDQWLVLGYNGYMMVDITGLAVWYLCVGALLFLGGLAALQGSKLGRVVGVVAAGLAAISEFFMIPYYPVWSIIMLILYVIVLWAFVAWKGPSPYGAQELPVEEAAPTIVPAPGAPVEPTIMAVPAVAAGAVVTPEPAVVAAPIEAPDDEQQPAGRVYALADIEGIGPAYAGKLGALGLKTTDDLLQTAATPKGREDLAVTTGISAKLILRWVNMADLFRIKGVGEEYSDLLEAAGVDTVPELAQRRADNLTQKMAEVNEQRQLVRRLPTQDQVTSWVETAKTLPRAVTY
jgi:predicted flap endonuclease-1-like 5' DNA nuclease